MKSILISIKPQHCANILNGLKTKEIRKRFPKDYRGWVYIYCTKEKPYLMKQCIVEEYGSCFTFKDIKCNGKVIARFYCDNVDMVYNYYLEEICALSCLTKDELLKYASDNLDDLYAINITKLEIFDRPKELSEFVHTTKERIFNGFRYDIINVVKHIEKAPQNYCYIEVEE